MSWYICVCYCKNCSVGCTVLTTCSSVLSWPLVLLCGGGCTVWTTGSSVWWWLYCLDHWFLCAVLTTGSSVGVDNPRSTMGFVERQHKEPVQDWVFGRPEDNHNVSKARTGFVDVPERDGSGSGLGSGSGARSRARAERAVALLRAQRSLSPEGHRSSSLPPAAHRTIPPPSTPSTYPWTRPLPHCSSERHFSTTGTSGGLLLFIIIVSFFMF